MSGEFRWTVRTSPDVNEQILNWARAGGALAELAAEARHCLQLLAISGTGAGDSTQIRGVERLRRIRNDKVRVYYDTAPGYVVVVAVVEKKLRGDHPQKVYQQYARKVAEFKAIVVAETNDTRGSRKR